MDGPPGAPFVYNATPVEVERCPQRPATHAVVRFWFSTPAPYVMMMLAQQADTVIADAGLVHGHCTWHEGHPDDRRESLVITVPCAFGQEAAAAEAAKLTLLDAADAAAAALGALTGALGAR